MLENHHRSENCVTEKSQECLKCAELADVIGWNVQAPLPAGHLACRPHVDQSLTGAGEKGRQYPGWQAGPRDTEHTYPGGQQSRQLCPEGSPLLHCMENGQDMYNPNAQLRSYHLSQICQSQDKEVFKDGTNIQRVSLYKNPLHRL